MGWECHQLSENILDFQIPPSFWWSTDKMSLNCGRISRPNDRTPRTHGSDIWQHRIEMETAKLPQKHSHFVTIFDLSQSSICYLSQFAKCHRRLQTTRLDKKGPKTLILAELPEKIEICPLSPIFHSCQIALMRKIVLFYTNQWNFMKSSYSTEKNLSGWENIDLFFHFFAKGFTTLKTIKLP